MRPTNLHRHAPVCPGKRLTIQRLRNIGRVEVVGDCWEWRGLHLRDGYGLLPPIAAALVGEKRAHRAALMLHLKRPLRDDEQALHRCDNPPCIRPAHLFAGSNGDNVADRVRKGRSYTRRGGRPC